MTPKFPYILSALVRWIEDNGYTPMLVAGVDAPGTIVPEGYARDGLITLNVSQSAVQGLSIDEEGVAFAARFGGRHFDVRLPPESLRVVFAREDPQASGVSLAPLVSDLEETDTQGDPRPIGPPDLKVV